MPDGESQDELMETTRASPRRRFVAFLSYSHRDAEIGEWLQRRLEAYSVPKALIGRLGPSGPIARRLGKVFRDRVDLAAANDLSSEIRTALEDAGALIVVCSPHSRGSPYVEEEIRTFKSLGRGERIFAAIVSGEPHASAKPGYTAADECFPRALMYKLDADGVISTVPEFIEPIAADFRAGKDGRENGTLKVIAGILGLDLDELVQREKQAERNRRVRANTIAASMAILALAAIFAGGFALVQRNTALNNEMRAIRGEASARDAQQLAEQNAEQREEQRRIADFNAEQAQIQALAAQRGEQSARNALGRVFAERGWDAIRRGQLGLAARYALAGWQATPANAPDFRAVLGRALHDVPEPVSLRGHDASIVAVAFSPQGTMLISGSADATARVWSTRTGEQLANLTHPEGAVRSVEFSLAGDLAVTAAGNSAYVWDTHTWSSIAHLQGHTERVNRAMFDGSGRFIATTSDDNSAMLWDARTGERMFVTRRHPRNVTVARFGADYRTLLTVSGDWAALWNTETGVIVAEASQSQPGRVGLDTYLAGDSAYAFVSDGLQNSARVIDVRTQREVATLRVSSPIAFGTFLARGRRVSTSSLDGVVRIWDVASGQSLFELEGHTGFVTHMRGDGESRLVTGGLDGSVRVWDVAEGRQLGVFRGSQQMINAVALSSDGQQIAGASEDRVIRVWSVLGDRLLRQTPAEALVNFVRFSPDGSRIALAGDSGRVRILSFSTLAQLSTIDAEASVAAATFGFDGAQLCTAAANGMAQVWDVASRRVIHRYEHGGSVTYCDVSADGARIATSGSNGVMRVWNAHSGAVVRDLILDGPVLAGTFAQDARAVVVALRGSIQIWDIDSGKVTREFRHATGGFSVAVSRERIASAGLEDSMVWDARTGAQIAVLRGQRSAVRIVFSPDATRIATASLDGSIGIWDTESGTMLARWQGHDGSTLAVAFSPDGNYLTTAGGGTVRVWNVARLTQSLQELSEAACGDLLTDTGPRFSETEIAADPLIRVVWLAERDEESGVCGSRAGR